MEGFDDEYRMDFSLASIPYENPSSHLSLLLQAIPVA